MHCFVLAVMRDAEVFELRIGQPAPFRSCAKLIREMWKYFMPLTAPIPILQPKQ
jgi:hypothetical protein